MDGMWRILILSLVLGIWSFIIGILPLSFTFSAKRRLQLSTFGNGLLLGAALGIIIPEGVDAVLATEGSSSNSRISLSLLVGFAFMLILEQYLTPHGTSTTPSRSQPVFEMPTLATDTVDVDDELDISADINLPTTRDVSVRPISPGFPVQVVANPLTLGLVIHSLADGLALGASASGEHSSDKSVSTVVFIALIIHKSPTALALTTSLLSTSLPRPTIKKHVAVFSAATPLGAVISFILLHFIGAHVGNWTGVALLISGGTFLYVATVIQPIGAHSHDHGDDSFSTEELSKPQRICLLVSGIFLPFMIGSLVGHEHEGGGHVH